MGSGNGEPITSRVYVDMVGDLFHAGHVELLRAARAHGDYLIVGVLSDETATAYKRTPIMKLAERVAVVEACRYVDEVIADAPFEVGEAFLLAHDIATVVHGDDLSPEGERSSTEPHWQQASSRTCRGPRACRPPKCSGASSPPAPPGNSTERQPGPDCRAPGRRHANRASPRAIRMTPPCLHRLRAPDVIQIGRPGSHFV